MADALRAEMFKIVRRRMTYILLAAFAGLIALFYFILWLRIRQGPDPGFNGLARYVELKQSAALENVVPYGLRFVRTFGTLVSVVFAAVMMGNEYDWRTVGVVVSRGVPRWQFLMSKLITAVAFALVAVLTGFLVATVASSVLTYTYDLSWGPATSERWLDTVASLGRTVFVVLPFVLMALLFATIWRSAGQAVGFSLGFFFLEGIFTSLLESAHGWLAHVPEALLNVNASAVMQANGVLSGSQDRGPFSVSSGGPSVWRGAAVLAAYLAAFGIVSFWRFSRRDIQE